MGARLKWVDEQKDAIIEYYNSGEKIIIEVADYFKISPSVIKNRLHEWKTINSDCNRRKKKNIPKNDFYMC